MIEVRETRAGAKESGWRDKSDLCCSGVLPDLRMHCPVPSCYPVAVAAECFPSFLRRGGGSNEVLGGIDRRKVGYHGFYGSLGLVFCYELCRVLSLY
jgi:hypothetical protein